MVTANPTVSPSAVPAVRDARYYFDDGGLTFLVRLPLQIQITDLTTKEILYKLHKTRLTPKSEFFAQMFEIPQGNSRDGLDDEHPIVLPDSNIHFRHLLEFLYDQDESRKYTIPSGVKYAVAKLPTHSDFTPALQLRLARQYSVLHWADLGFCSLVYRRLKNITQADAENMGVVAFHKLVQVHCQIDELNRGLAFSPPTVLHSPGCLDEPVCTRLWESAWWSGYAKQLLHPESAGDHFKILSSMDPSKGILVHMGPGCLANTMQSIREDNPFNEDNELITTASTELTAWMEDS
ncbi:hypothetical protein B0H11DRAFT_2218099 [Mycena galericulata]|nr:hypothetical protein B0H11DRAFT_2218099 [Mycena galericulata]